MNPVMVVNTPFIQVELPVTITFIAAAWLNGKRFDDFRSDMNRRFQDFDRRFEELRANINTRFDSVERRLEMIQDNTHSLNIRVTRLETRF